MSFESLAIRTGISLPPAFASLLADGGTRYGENAADWKAHWSDYTLRAQPLLSCAYDLEWIDARKAGEIVDGWLNPGFQNGRAFLPFAISGAGDAYCLMRAATGETGVGLVWHDKHDSAIQTADFEQFVFASLVESAADFEHLLDDFSPAQSRECVLANVRAAAAYLPDYLNRTLDALMAPESLDEQSESGMISAQLAKAALSVVLPFEQERFAVTPRWSCGER